MMNNAKYIKTKLSQYNEFRLDYSQIELLEMNFSNVSIKVDTGCPYTTIPIKRLNIPDDLALTLKSNDIDLLINNILKKENKGCSIKDAINSERNSTFKISYGVERGGMKNPLPDFKDKDSLLNCTSISFKHTLSNIILSRKDGDDIFRYDLGQKDVFINYDRMGNILLGMDIMKNWDIHIGTVDTGETIFLACPKDKINEEYLLEFERLFHVHSLIDSTIIRQKIEQTKGQII